MRNSATKAPSWMVRSNARVGGSGGSKMNGGVVVCGNVALGWGAVRAAFERRISERRAWRCVIVVAVWRRVVSASADWDGLLARRGGEVRMCRALERCVRREVSWGR